MSGTKTTPREGRWALYRLLAEPGRLRLLALIAEAELSVGELAELLEDSQPNVSRYATSLRRGGLVRDRRHGTRTFIRLSDWVSRDPVVSDAIGEGRRLCREEGRLDRISTVVRRRDLDARRDFEAGERDRNEIRSAVALPAYALAVAQLTQARGIAIDAGTGDGAMLDILAPFFRRVIAIDRSPLQLKRAQARISQRAYQNVELLCGEIDDRELRLRVGDGADAVFATRQLQRTVSPRVTMAALTALLRPGGELVVVDYLARDDEGLRDHQADERMGFTKGELLQLVGAAGLVRCAWLEIPKEFVGLAADGNRQWQLVCATRPEVTP
jgi:ArsR family transcriptional regulator